MCMSEDLFGPAACVAFIFRTLEKHCLRRSLPREETCTGCLLHMPLPSPCAEEQAEEKTEPFRKHQDRQCPGQAGSTISSPGLPRVPKTSSLSLLVLISSTCMARLSTCVV